MTDKIDPVVQIVEVALNAVRELSEKRIDIYESSIAVLRGERDMLAVRVDELETRERSLRAFLLAFDKWWSTDEADPAKRDRLLSNMCYVREQIAKLFPMPPGWQARAESMYEQEGQAKP